MKRQDVVADVITYNTLISTFCKGKQLDKALQLFEEMQEQRLVPDVITYSKILNERGALNKRVPAHLGVRNK